MMKDHFDKLAQDEKDRRDGLKASDRRPPMRHNLRDFDEGDREGMVDREHGRVVNSNTETMQARKDEMNWEGDPTGQISRRRVEGDFVLSYYRNELMWRISRVDGEPTPAALSGRYTTPHACLQSIHTYQATSAAQQQIKEITND